MLERLASAGKYKLLLYQLMIIVGALGSTPKDLASYLSRLSITTSTSKTLQQSILYSTAHIFRRYLSICFAEVCLSFVSTPLVRGRSFYQ